MVDDNATAATVDTAVISPLPFTVITGIVVSEPYVPTFEFTVANVIAALSFALPLKLTDQVASPVVAIVRAVASVVAVEALPVSAPVKVAVVRTFVDGLYVSPVET